MKSQDVLDIAAFTMKVIMMSQVDQIARFNGSFPAALRDLHKIAKALDNLAVAQCNYGWTEAQEIAQKIGVTCYFQGDPRGMSLYLLPYGVSREDARQNYVTDGIAVPY